MSTRKLYIETNQANILSPIGLLGQIEKISNEITEFETNVDVQLSLVNATTVIEIQG